jgi:hypothetical protein
MSVRIAHSPLVLGQRRRGSVAKLFGKSDVSRNRGSGGGQEGSKGPDRPLLGADEALSKDPRLFSKQFLHALR